MVEIASLENRGKVFQKLCSEKWIWTFLPIFWTFSKKILCQTFLGKWLKSKKIKFLWIAPFFRNTLECFQKSEYEPTEIIASQNYLTVTTLTKNCQIRGQNVWSKTISNIATVYVAKDSSGS